MKKLIFITCLILTIGILPIAFNLGHQWFDCDFVSQQIPFILETKRMLESGSPWWSWNTFVGDNFLGAYSFYTVTSPFVWLVCLFPTGKILWGILLSLYLKTVCTACFSFIFFRKLGFNSSLSLLGSLLYCFSSFYICNLFYFHFCEPIMIFPLLLISLVDFLNGKRFSIVWLTLISFVTVFINFYFALPSFLLGLLFFLFLGYDEKNLSWSLSLKAIGCVLLGIGISGIILLPSICHNFGSSRAQFSFFFNCNPNVLLIDFFGTLRSYVMPSIAEGIGGFRDRTLIFPNASNEIYVTLFGAFTAIVYCKRNRNWLSRLLILLFVISLTPLNGIFSGFSNQAYTRWFYGFDIFIIVSVLYILKDSGPAPKEVRSYSILSISIVIVNLIINKVYGSATPEGVWINQRMIIELILFLINISLLILCFSIKTSIKKFILFSGLCGFMNLFATTYLYSKTDEFNVSESDYIYRDIFSNSVESEKQPFRYRTDVYSSSRNYAMIYDEPGVIGFHSSMNPKLNVLRSTVQDNILIPTFFIDRHRASFSALFSIKEVKDFRNGERWGVPYSEGLVKVDSSANYDLYMYRNYIPMGFAYNSFITNEELAPYIEASDSIDIPLMMLDNLVIHEKDRAELSKILSRGRINFNVDLDSLSRIRRQITSTDFEGTSKGFTCNTDFEKPEIILFSVASDSGFTAYIDNKQTEIFEVNLGLMAIKVPEGKHQIKFSFIPPGLKSGLILSSISLLLLLILTIIIYRKHYRTWSHQ